MFNPITASQEIKDAFTDYITTTFDFADPDYADELKKSIQESAQLPKDHILKSADRMKVANRLQN